MSAWLRPRKKPSSRICLWENGSWVTAAMTLGAVGRGHCDFRRRSGQVLELIANRSGTGASGALQTVKTSAPHTQVEPATHGPPLRIEIAGGAPGLKEDVMEDLFRVIALPKDPEAETEHRSGMPIVERSKGRSVASGDGHNEP